MTAHLWLLHPSLFIYAFSIFSDTFPQKLQLAKYYVLPSSVQDPSRSLLPPSIRSSTERQSVSGVRLIQHPIQLPKLSANFLRLPRWAGETGGEVCRRGTDTRDPRPLNWVTWIAVHTLSRIKHHPGSFFPPVEFAPLMLTAPWWLAATHTHTRWLQKANAVGFKLVFLCFLPISVFF